VTTLAVGLATLLLAASGYLVWRRIAPANCGSPPTSLGVALPVGVVLLGIESLLWAHAAPDRSVGFWSLIAPLALLSVLAYASGFRRRPLPEPSPPRLPSALGAAGFAASLIIAAEIGLSYLSILVDPRLVDWDGWAIWGIKAKAFFMDGGVHRYLAHAHDYAFSWPARPCLSALFESFLYHAVGGVEEGAARLGHLALFASLLLVFYSSLRRRYTADTSMIWTALLATVPNLTYQAIAGVANVVLGLYLFAALDALDAWQVDPRVERVAGPALLLAGACLSRDEGFALAGLTAACVFLTPPFPSFRNRYAKLTALLGLSFASAAAYALWASLVKQHGASDELLARWTSAPGAWSRLLSRRHELSQLIGPFLEELALPTAQARCSPLENALRLSLFWPSFGLACVCGGRLWRTDPMAFRCALIATAGLVTYAVALAVFPDSDMRGVIHDWVFVFDRHALVVAPMAMRTMAGVFGAALESRVSSQRGRRL
jgi:hypothetical protein